MGKKIEETKGFLAIRGKIFGLDNKEAFENEYKRNLSFGINTSKDNGIFITVGGWKNSQLTVNVKGEGMDKAVKVTEQEAIDEIQGLFKNGDSVFIGLRADINTYSKRIDYVINKIFIADEGIDFEAGDFEEKNELSLPSIIAGKLDGNKQKVVFATYKGEILEQIITIEDKDILDYFKNDVSVGDIIQSTLRVVKKPIYEEVEESKEDKPEEKVRKTFKGKSVGGTQQKKRGKIIGNIDLLILDDIEALPVDKNDNTKSVKGAYKLSDLALEKTDNSSDDMPF